jgi:hypothetical protein
LITSSPVNHASQTTSTDFRNKIGPSRHFVAMQHFGRFRSKTDIELRSKRFPPLRKASGEFQSHYC